MTSFLQFLSTPHSIRFGWALIHILWQGLVIAALLELALTVVRPKNASLRYILCGGALLLFPICLAATFSLIGEGTPQPNTLILPHDQNLPPLPAASTSASSLPSLISHPLQSSVRNSPSSPSLDLNPYIPTIVALWLLGVLLLAARKAGGFLVIWRLRHRSLVAPTQALLDRFHRICQRLGVDPNRVALKISSLISVPITMGWLKPIVLLPASLLSGLTSSEVELLLAHELAHIRRHDYLINLFQTVVETFFFYHPRHLVDFAPDETGTRKRLRRPHRPANPLKSSPTPKSSFVWSNSAPPAPASSPPRTAATSSTASSASPPNPPPNAPSASPSLRSSSASSSLSLPFH